MEARCQFLTLYTHVLHGISTFDITIFAEVCPGFWPRPSSERCEGIAHAIMTHEAVRPTAAALTRALLKIALNVFRQPIKAELTPERKKMLTANMITEYCRAINFV